MATYPKATLNLKYTDENNKQKTFNVGYINPEVSDGTLKELGNKLIALTDNTLDEVYKTVQENITNAQPAGTTYRTPTLITTSAFLSTDAETWNQFVTESVSGSGTFSVSVTDSEDNEIVLFDLTANEFGTILELEDYSGANFWNMIGARLINNYTGEKVANLAFTSNSIQLSSSTVPNFAFKISANGSTKPLLQSMYDNADETSKTYFTVATSSISFTLTATGGN